MSENLSLFGWPMPELRDVAGRPEHEATEENRCKVMMLLAFGRTNKDIAAALGISQPTLRKHYLQELSQRRVARLQLEGQRFAAVYQKAIVDRDGPMLKELGKMLDRHELEDIQRRFGEGKSEKPAKLGKKELAIEAASTAGTDSEWGEDLVPPGTRAH